jgi:hypothetical protein
MIEVARSRAFLVKKDIFRNLMWYSLPESNKQYPLTIERVRKIKELNRQGIKPEELEPVEVVTGKPKDIEPVYADVVGQISLKSLEKTSRKRRDSERRQQPPRRQGGNQQQDGNRQNEQGQQGGNQQNRSGQNRNQQGGQNQQRSNQQNRQQRPPQSRNQQGGQNQQRPKQNPNNKGGDKK